MFINYIKAKYKCFYKWINASSIRNRLFSGMMWSVFGGIVSKVIALFLSVILARILGKRVFGEYGIIQSTLSMFIIVAGLGIGITGTKYVAEFKNTDKDRAGSLIGLIQISSVVAAVVIALLFALITPWLSKSVLSAPHIYLPLILSSFLLLFNSINAMQIGILAGFEAFKPIALVNFLGSVISMPIIVFCGLYYKLNGVIIGLIINSVIVCIISHFILIKILKNSNITVDYKNLKKEKELIYKYSLPAMLSGLMIVPVNWICNTLLVNQPNGYGEMGGYNAANQWFNALMFLPGLLGQAVLPILSEQSRQNDKKVIKAILFKSSLMNAILVIPLMIILCIFSKAIMSLYGDGFQNYWITMVYSVVAASILAILSQMGNFIAALNKMWIGLLMNLGWGVIFVFFSNLYIDKGAEGIALSRLIAYAVHTLWTVIYIRSYTYH